MAGLNHVRAGGDPLELRLAADLQLIKVSVGPMDNNAYLLIQGDAGVLIDAAHSADRLLEVFAERPVETIITTHRHADHWQALGRVSAATGARLVAGTPDVPAIAAGAGVPDPIGLWDGGQVELGGAPLEVIGLAGHTPGSIALACVADGVTHLFTGDSLFPGGPGRTGSPADFTSLMDDLERKIFARFDDETVVHPGHGDDTTLGAERPHLTSWRVRGW